MLVPLERELDQPRRMTVVVAADTERGEPERGLGDRGLAEVARVARVHSGQLRDVHEELARGQRLVVKPPAVYTSGDSASVHTPCSNASRFAPSPPSVAL